MRTLSPGRSPVPPAAASWFMGGAWTRGFTIGAVVALSCCGLYIGDVELGSSGVQSLSMTEREPQLNGKLTVVPQFKSGMRALQREVEFLKAELNATQSEVVAAQADIYRRRLALGDPVPPVTPEDLANEDSARRRLRNYFLAIPMMTAGLPKQQTVQMVSNVYIITNAAEFIAQGEI